AAHTADFEILAVDGNSTDGTLEKLRALQKQIPQLRILVQPKDQRGHGRALLLGYRAASKNWIFQLDSDAQFDPSELSKLTPLASDHDFITGIRQNRQDPVLRLLLSWCIRLTLLLATGLRLRDPNCPFRLMSRAALLPLLDQIPENSIAPNIFLSILARTAGLRTKEVRITHKERKEDNVKRQRFLKLALAGLLQFLKFKPVKEQLFPFLVILSIVAAQQIPSLMSPPGRDAGSFAYAANELCVGKTMYRDIWDHKPPFIFFLYAGIFKLFGSKLVWAVLFEMAWTAATGLLFLKLLQRFFKFETALWGAVLFSIYFSSLEISESYGMTETYSAACVLAGFYALLRGAGKPAWAFTSGLFLSFGFLFRQTALFALPAAATALYLFGRDPTHATRKLLTQLAAAAAG
ncbi:MAG TPA: glycosyltransferase, partial [Elusimicrobiales bacterium]|nr:glycosyltransferase [Elusimicrobiales bacterium]